MSGRPRYPVTPGEVFGRWTVIGEAPVRQNHSYVLVRCICGTERELNFSAVRLGRTKSCGGLQHTHGMYGTKTYRSWDAMVRRCKSISDPKKVADYQARGITVCARWHSFQNFLADMGECPSGMSLDRVDNDGNYEPENCRWATRSQQQRNRRKSIWIIVPDGSKLHLLEACEAFGILAASVRQKVSLEAITHQAAFDHFLRRNR